MIFRNKFIPLFLILSASQVFAADLTVTVENISSTNGAIHIALFTASDEFPDA